MKKEDLDKISIGDEVFFANRFYEVADISKQFGAKMIGIYDEPPSKHIDFLNPNSIDIVRFKNDKIQTTEKGFKVIELNVEQMLKLGGMCICDSCNNAMFTGTFIGALNRVYCATCFENFNKTATYYPEDSKFEENSVNRVIQKIVN